MTAGGGVLIKKLDIGLPETVTPVAWATFIGAFVIFGVEAWRKNHIGHERIGWDVAVAVGLAQILAAVFPAPRDPGRASSSRWRSARRARRRRNFLSRRGSHPDAAGAFQTLSVIKDGEAGNESWSMIALGTLVSAVSAFIVVKWLIRFVQSHSFNGFAWYRLVMGRP